MVDICQEGHSQTSAPQRRHRAPLRCSESRKLSGWDGGGDKMHCPTWGECVYQAPGHLRCSDLGRAQNAGPTEAVPLWSTWEPEPEQLRPGKCMQPRACFRQFPCRTTWSLSSVDPGSTRHLELGQTQCGSDTASTPHTCQWYVFAVFPPPHSTTEQVSLSKWPPSPPCVRVEIRHWRDLQTEETKINRGNCFGSDWCNRLKPCS